MQTENQLIYVVSDLHMAEGDLGHGNYLGTENFFADREFTDLVHFIHQEEGTISKTLIINGDFVDFIRISTVPQPNQMDEWQREIDKVANTIRVSDSDVSKKEKRYGLRTNDYKTIWKLHLCMAGHKSVFNAIAHWLSTGNQLEIFVGNHDPEWYWPLLQDYFRIRIRELQIQGGMLSDESTSVINQIRFHTSGQVYFGTIWVEHGNQFDRSTRMCEQFELDKCQGKSTKQSAELEGDGHAGANKSKELFLPFGSFFNRYLINKVELDFPYVNNITSKSVVKAVFQEDFGLAFKISFHYLWYALFIVYKFYKKSILSTVAFFLVSVLPVALVIFFFYKSLTDGKPMIQDIPEWLSSILAGLRNLSFFLLRYIFQWLLRKLKITQDPLRTLVMDLQQDTGRLEKYDAVIVGHNHLPELQKLSNGKFYINTGAWIRKYDVELKHVQFGTKFPIARLFHSNGTVKSELLEWDPHHRKMVPFQSIQEN